MSVINELIRTEENGNISFGNYSLDSEIQSRGSSMTEIFIK